MLISRQRRRIPAKTCGAAIALVVVGIILFGVAIDFFVKNPDHAGSLPLLILSILGSFATTHSAF